MALKKMTFKEKRELWLEAIEDQVSNFAILDSWKKSYLYHDVLQHLYSQGSVPSKDLNTCVKEHYGKPEKENELEFRLARILYIYFLLTHFHDFLQIYQFVDKVQKSIKTIINSTFEKLTEYLPDYEIDEITDELASYRPKSTKTITDNLNDIEVEKAKPIKELLNNMKSDTELKGHINEVYAVLGSMNLKSYQEKLNKNDWGILNDSYKLAKRIVNDAKDGAKGHAGKSSLSTRDIAHNFALLVSLVYKLAEKTNK